VPDMWCNICTHRNWMLTPKGSMEEVMDVATSSDPRMANRETLGMNITYEVFSALAGCRTTIVVSLPPSDLGTTENLSRGVTGLHQLGDARPKHPTVIIRKELIGQTDTPGHEFSLGQEQVALLHHAVSHLRIVPASDSFKIHHTCDGWSSTICIDSCDAKLNLDWFCDPPAEWTGVSELCESIRRVAWEARDRVPSQA
jgi:hypothetical protein